MTSSTGQLDTDSTHGHTLNEHVVQHSAQPTIIYKHERICRDGHETSMAETETRPRRDVCRSRDVTETLKCTFIVINAALILLKQVNVVGLTTVAILSPRVRLFHGRYTAVYSSICTVMYTIVYTARYRP